MLPNAHTEEFPPHGDIPVSRQDVLTDDALEILQYAADAVAAGIPAALVTLVEVHGGAARQPGAQMVVLADGRYCGFVSGGCVEAAAAREASDAMLDGTVSSGLARVPIISTSCCPAVEGSRSPSTLSEATPPSCTPWSGSIDGSRQAWHTLRPTRPLPLLPTLYLQAGEAASSFSPCPPGPGW